MVAIRLRARGAWPIGQQHGESAAAGGEGSVRRRETPPLCKRRDRHDRHGPAVPFAAGDSDCGCPGDVSAAPDDARRARAEGVVSRILRLRGIDAEDYPSLLAVEKRRFQSLSDRGMRGIASLWIG